MALKTQTLPEDGGFLQSEAPDQRSREEITLASGDLQAGAILTGTGGTVSAPVADAGNAGDGTFAATPTGGEGVKAGDYRLVVIEPATDAGTFVLYDPDGVLVAAGTVGSAFDNQLAFTLQDGATDFAAGDAFTISVEAPDWVEHGAGEVARGILWADTDASAAAQSAVAIVRDATVTAAELVHFTGATDAQKAQALRDLRRAGIIAR